MDKPKGEKDGRWEVEVDGAGASSGRKMERTVFEQQQIYIYTYRERKKKNAGTQ